MKIILFFLLLLLPIIPTSAQIQRGYTKTRGVLNKNGSVTPGKRLAKVIISFRDGRTSVISDSIGDFTFPVREDVYTLQDVQKNGYRLLDPDILNRECYYTPQEPLVLTLETLDAILDNQLTTQRLIRQQLEKRLRSREMELDSLKAWQAITIEEYRQKLQALYAERSQSEQLVKDMAEQYSKIDFDLINDFYRQVSAYILNGELFKADSMLNTKGSLNDRIASYRKLQVINNREKEELARRQKALARNQLYGQHALEDLGQECYSRYEIAKLRFQNDSAAYYIETRALLDTLNATWQLVAGKFIDKYLADYNRSLLYYCRALRNAKTNEETAVAYNNVGSVYSSMGDYRKALEYLEKAMTIQKTEFGDNHWSLAMSYNNIGGVYSLTGDYPKALEYFKKALVIQKTVFGDNHPNVATSYNNIGTVYSSMGEYSKALEYLEKALTIRKSVLGENHPDVATSYNNIGGIYSLTEEYSKALEYYEKALAIQKAIFGNNHPTVAASYNNIGNLYKSMNEYSHALEYYDKILNISISIYGELHMNTAWCYYNIGEIYLNKNDYHKGLEYTEKSLNVYLANNDENTLRISECYSRMGGIYLMMKNYELALEYVKKALNIQMSIMGENAPSTIENNNLLGVIYSFMGEFDVALEYMIKALNARILIYGKNDPYTIESYNNIASIYLTKEDYDSALEYLQKILVANISNFGEIHIQTAESYHNIGSVYACKGDYNNAWKFMKKALSILQHNSSDNQHDIIMLKKEIEKIEQEIYGTKTI